MKAAIKKLVIIQVFVLFSIISVFATTHSVPAGSVSGIWIVGDTYEVQGDIYISSGNRLTIPNNVIVRFQGSYKLTVEGTLTISGTSGNEVILTALNHTSGWQGIDISNNSNLNEINYCIIEYVKKTPGICGYNFTDCASFYLNSSDNTKFYGCTFRYNEVCTGGGIAFISSHINVFGCQFYNNSALNKGGGIYITDAVNSSSGDQSIIDYCDFEINSADDGGALYIDDCVNDIRITNNHFISNYAINGAGCYLEDITGTVNSIFQTNQIEDNIATGLGGGIYIATSTFNQILDNIIRQNEANDGGGLYVYETDIDNFRSNLIENNSADNNGGGLYLEECYMKMIFGQVKDNHSYYDGGGVYIDLVSTSGYVNFLINCLIVGNDARINGGGIYANATFNQYNSTISTNDAIWGTGGGIYHNNCNSTTVNTIIWGNSANSFNEVYPAPNGNNGYSYTCCSTTVINCTTCKNTDPNFIGSGNYMITYPSSCNNTGDNNVQYEPFDLDGNNRITDNVIDIGAYEDPYIYRNGNICNETWTDQNTNGIDYIITDDITITSGCTLTINPGTTIAFYGTKYMDLNGTISAVGNSNNYITFTTTDPINGWLGIDISGNSNQNTFEYCKFEKAIKTPQSCGGYSFNSNGTVFVQSSNYTSFDHCIFQDNIICHTGGGIHFIHSTANVSYCSFINNTVSMHGGGISIKFPGNTAHNINHCTFTGNSANKGGGGIWITNGGTTNITSCDFNNNTTYGAGGGSCPFCNGGGAIGMVSDDNNLLTVTISGGNIYENTATQSSSPYGNGGGIFAYLRDWSTTRINLNINDIHIHNNTASNNGGGIFVYDEPVPNDQNDIYGIDLTINRTYIQENSATNNGGGIYLNGLTNPNSDAIYNNLITNNEASGNGGGVFMETSSSPLIYNCTIADNTASNTSGYAGGVYFDNTSTPIFKNTIVWGNIPTNSDVKNNGFDPNPNNVGLYTYCDFKNFTYPYYSNYNTIDDPKFITQNGINYLLSYSNSSPCIGTGDNSISPQASTDLKGDIRILPTNGVIDMGAYEYEFPNPSYKISQNDSIIETKFNKIIVYPNPTEQGFSVQIYSEYKEVVTVSLLNTLGEKYLETKLNLLEGNNLFYLERNNVASGIYYLKVNSNSFNMKIIKLILK